MTPLAVLAAVLAAACTIAVPSSPARSQAWSPVTFSDAGEMNTRDIYIGDERWMLCVTIDALPMESGGTGDAFVAVKKAAPPHYFVGSVEAEGPAGASRCNLMRIPPGHYYFAVVSRGRWTLAANRAP